MISWNSRSCSGTGIFFEDFLSVLISVAQCVSSTVDKEVQMKSCMLLVLF